MRGVFCLTIACLLISASAAAESDPWQRPSMVKRSFRHLEWGFGFNLGASFYATDHDTGVFFADGDYSQEREAGIAGGAFLGYGAGKEIIVGVEGQYWPASFSGELGDERWNVIVTTATARWYPGSVGLCLKGGFGLVYAAGDLEDLAASAEPLRDEFHDTSYALQGGVGYEYRLPIQGSVVTFGPFVEYVYMPLGNDLTANAVTVKIQLQWHTSDRELDRYFRREEE